MVSSASYLGTANASRANYLSGSFTQHQLVDLWRVYAKYDNCQQHVATETRNPMSRQRFLSVSNFGVHTVQLHLLILTCQGWTSLSSVALATFHFSGPVACDFQFIIFTYLSLNGSLHCCFLLGNLNYVNSLFLFDCSH